MFRSCVFIVVSILKFQYYKSKYSFKKKKKAFAAQMISWRDFQSPYSCTVLDIWLKIYCLCQRALFMLLTKVNCAVSRQEFCNIFTAKFPELHFVNF